MGIKVYYFKLGQDTGQPCELHILFFSDGEIEADVNHSQSRPSPHPCLSSVKAFREAPRRLCAQDYHHHKGCDHVMFLVFIPLSPKRKLDAGLPWTQLTSAIMVSPRGMLSLWNLRCVSLVWEGFNTQALGSLIHREK